MDEEQKKYKTLNLHDLPPEWTCTIELRWNCHSTYGYPNDLTDTKLEQKWINNLTGEIQWRPIPEN